MQESEREQKTKSKGVRIRTVNAAMIVLTSLIAFVFLQTAQGAALEYEALNRSTESYIACEKAANELMTASTYLTGQTRLFASTSDIAYLNNYFRELDETRRRDHAVGMLEAQHPDSQASEYLEQALAFSNQLAKREMYAMELIVNALDLNIDADIARKLDEVGIRETDRLLTSSEQIAKARIIVANEPYERMVNRIRSSVDSCILTLEGSLEDNQQQHAANLQTLLTRQQILTYVLLVSVFATILVVVFMVLWPIQDYIARIGQNTRLEERGSFEMRFFSRAYNTMYDESARTRDQLVHEAEHDGLTGLYNRGAFEKLLATRQHDRIALIMFDVDHFKEINDLHGHDSGDLVLKRVAESLTTAFRSTDYACRVGGDEFAVIMDNGSPELEETIRNKVAAIVDRLQDVDGKGLRATLSVGVAFGDGTTPPDQLYKQADNALYRVKAAGRDGIAFEREPAGDDNLGQR